LGQGRQRVTRASEIVLTPWERPLDAYFRPPGDKSITHRAILFSALVAGTHTVDGWLDAHDTRSSLRLAEALGVVVREQTRERLILDSPGRSGWREPRQPVDCGNSGTTMRLGIGLSTGLLGGLTVLYGDPSLSARPMARVAEPLRGLGAQIWTRSSGTAPVAIWGGPLRGGSVKLPVASAQVKSAVLLAGLWAEEAVTVQEPLPSRDHSERLLQAMEAEIRVSADGEITVEGPPRRPLSLTVPGDPSSAAFWAALAALLPGSRMVAESVSLNPGRLGFYEALRAMGAEVSYQRAVENPEPAGDIVVSARSLRAIHLAAPDIPAVIDELPLLALLATQAHGRTVITGAGELRVKESDRIRATAEGLSRLGAEIRELADGWEIEGPTPLRGGEVEAFEDHRIAMMLAVAAAVASGPVRLQGAEAVAISYPDFFATYERLRAGGAG
jgi:3-phosphoshikimate 1-carboxyvinyltransferase